MSPISTLPAPAIRTANQLAEEQMPLVGYLLREVASRLPQHFDRDELASAGYLALVKASRSFDDTLGVPFNRYAALRIKGAMLDELRTHDWMTRQGRTLAKTMQATDDAFRSTNHRHATRDELAALLGVSVKDVDETRGSVDAKPLSLDVDDGSTVILSVDTGLTPEQHAETTERLAYLHAGVQSLPPRLRTIIEGVFFLDRSANDIAAELGLTPSRISQLRTEACSLLRDGMYASLDPDLVTAAVLPAGVQDRRRQMFYAKMASQADANAVRGQTGFIPPQRSGRATTPLNVAV